MSVGNRLEFDVEALVTALIESSSNSRTMLADGRVNVKRRPIV